MTAGRDALDAYTARRFRTGRVCLDFVHTGGVGRWTAAELIHDPADAGHWLAVVLDLATDVRATRADVEPLRRLREALWQLAQRSIAGKSLPARHVAVVNAAAERAPIRMALTTGGRSCAVAPVDARQALSVIARDAIDLFAGPLRERIRTCAADDCDLLFVDTSRPGQRRWCSMNRCGTRAKMARYRGR